MQKLSQCGVKNKIFIFFLTLSIFALSGFVSASDELAEIEVKNKEYYIHLDGATIKKGYTVSDDENKLKLSLVPGILSESTGVDIIELNEEMEMPWRLDRISSIFQFEFRNKLAYDNHKPFYIQFSYDKASNNYKQVYFYDKNFNAWRPLPTRDYPDEKFVRSLIHLPFARIAVFDNQDVMSVGRASWYAYKGGNFAASPDFPKGSRLRVHNPDNGKYVDVVINDYGPERHLHPDRSIDLDKVAFSRIASLGAGIIDTIIEPLYVKPVEDRVLGMASTGAALIPEISSRSFIVIEEETGEVIYEKNSTSTFPIASLTKLVAIKTFMDTRPSLNNVVSYSVNDEEYNYEYVNKWESARLKLKDGDTLTIEDLLYASLVGSANNTIETIVRVSGLGRDDFIKRMNENVKLWGAASTKFIEPTGLSPDNVSSAADYGIITKEVYKNPIIQKTSTMDRYSFYTENTEEYHRVINTNKIIATNKFNITGSKTGYLDEALYCLMMRAKSPNGKQVIVVNLGSSTRDLSFSETKELMQYGFRKLK